jgi:putative ABC transport system permease protein
VAFGFASMALAGGFMAQSFSGLRASAIRGGIGHVQFATTATFDQQADTTLEHGLRPAGAIMEALRADPAVAVVMPRVEFVGLVTAGVRSVPFLGLGVDAPAEARGSDIPASVHDGRWLSATGDDIVLGRGLAANLGVHPGDVLTLLATTRDGTLNAVDATVAGIADVNVKELSDRYLATTLPLAQRLLGAAGSVSKISVLLREPADAAASGARLLARLRPLVPALAVKRWDELAVFYGQVRVLYLGIFSFMGTVLLLVVFLSAINATLMSVTERTREIGTLRALGARATTVVGNFVAEGAVLGLLGSGAGALLSILLTLVLNTSGIVLPPPPGSTHGFPIHVQIFAGAYGLAAVAMTATLAVASYFPARRAARAPIVDSLAHV